MAKRTRNRKGPKNGSKAKKVGGVDVPEDWEVEHVTEESPKEKRKFEIGNWVLWAAFIGVFLLFVLLPLLGNQPSEDLQTDFVNGIKIMAPGDPTLAIKNLPNLHIEGRRLDQLADSHDALNEILLVIGQGGTASGGSYTLSAGVTDTTGITMTGNTIRVEGDSRASFWKAVWTLNSIITSTSLESSADLFEVQNLFKDRPVVYLIQDQENTCSNYGRVISAEGDIISSLGFKQAQYGFQFSHLYRYDGGCRPAENESASPVACPQAGGSAFLINMGKGDSNTISITEDGIDFEYSDCMTVDRISVILRDLIYPNIVSSMSDISFTSGL
jgi:hypothetical protein